MPNNTVQDRTNLAGLIKKVAGKQNAIAVQDEGVEIASAGAFDTVNITGAGVTATKSGTTLTINVPSGGGLSDGDYGDITVGGSGTTLTIDNQAVTYAKIQNVTDARMLGNNSGSAGAVQEMTKGDVLSFIGYVAPKETLAVPVSFESGLQCNNTIKLGFACSLSQTYVYGIATSAIAATDDAVVTIAKNGAPIAGATITFAGSSAINTAGSVGTFTTTNFAAGDTISFIGAKTTAGGSALVSCTLTLI